MRKFKSFNVAGVQAKNKKSDSMTRLDMIIRYVSHGSTFRLEREPENKFDKNAIAVRQVFKSGSSIVLGYVPNNKKRGNLLADELAPLMDEQGWVPSVKFGRAHVDEKTGEVRGLQLRYEVTENGNPIYW